VTVGRAGVRGDLMLHPVALVGLAVLLLNDHVLKAAAPGWVTGKLSDVAGLAFFPFFLLAARHVVLGRAPGLRSGVPAAALTGAVFAAIKLSAPARELFTDLVGALRFPVDALVSGARSPVPVVVVPDVTDLAALLACGAVLVVLRRRSAPAGSSDAVIVEARSSDGDVPSCGVPDMRTLPGRADPGAFGSVSRARATGAGTGRGTADGARRRRPHGTRPTCARRCPGRTWARSSGT